MTVCNFCGKKEGYDQLFKSPYTCIECMRSEENYLKADDDENNIIFINSKGKKIEIAMNDEIDINVESPIDMSNYKDALIASLYSQVEFFKKGITRKKYDYQIIDII